MSVSNASHPTTATSKAVAAVPSWKTSGRLTRQAKGLIGSLPSQASDCA
jgi:hypothetical protein